MQNQRCTQTDKPRISLRSRFLAWWNRPQGERRGPLALEHLEDRVVPAVTVNEVLGINPGANSNISGAVNLNGTLYFAASNGTNGTQLWKSDGTTAGTVAVTNINIANGGLNPTDLTVMGNDIYFAGTDTADGTELWKSDGTTAGTTLLKDINPGTAGSDPQNMTVVGNTLYFAANDGVDGNELWETNGTTIGTVLVANINNGVASSNPTDLTAVGNTLFFAATNILTGTELWESQGTVPTTFLVADINPGLGSSTPTDLTNFNGTLYFAATNGFGTQLWESNGTALGTVIVTDLNVVGGGMNPTDLTVIGNTLYFAANDGTHGTELWTSDGATAGTAMLKDINPGAGSSSPTDLTNVNGTLYFAASDGTHGNELWTSDGTTAGTTMVDDINPGTGGSLPSSLTVINGLIYFTATDGTHGQQLWSSDGTAAGTVMASDLNPGATGGNPGDLTVVNNELFFAANNTATSRQLYLAVDEPVITSINSTTPNGTYAAGATIDVTLTFDSAVTLAGGDMSVTLNDGGVALITPFAASTTASGTYTVMAGDNASPLDASSITLAPGATLQDAQGDSATTFPLPTGHTLANTSAIIVNTGGAATNPSKIGVERASGGLAQFTVDSNGDGTADAGDAAFTYGVSSDAIVVGDWNKSGYDSVGVVRATSSGVAQWTIDTNEDGTYDAGDATYYFGENTDKFVAGDWTGSGTSDIGVARNTSSGVLEWVLDTSGTGSYVGTDTVDYFGENGDTPIVGDWTGSGKDNIGIVRQTSSGVLEWVLDTSGTGKYNGGDAVYFFGSNNDIPVVGDWNGTGKDEIGVMVPAANGSALWILDTNGTGVYSGTDKTYSYGIASDHPVVGAWKPGALMVAAGGPLSGSSVQPIAADATFASIVNEAIGAWQQAGISPQMVSKLENVNYVVGTLGNGVIGETSGNTITIDATAAGYGWSETPNPQTGRMDLFTTLAHEMGHELGLPDQTSLPGDLMYESLLPGTRLTPSTQDVDAAFAAMGK